MVRVGETAVLTVVLLLVSSATGGQSYPGVILQHPENQTIPIGGTGTFVCTAQGDAVWYIGNRWVSSIYQTELQGKGFMFVDEDLSSYEYPTVNLSMTVVVVDAEMNGTDIHCTTSGTDGSIAQSCSAFLWIVGPPLPPNVSLDLISWNSMRLSWTAPYTAEHFPINKYIIYTTNSSTGQRSRTDVYPTDGTGSLIIVDTPNNCHSLSFEVFAQNSVGTSSAGLISGGFPIGVSEFTVDMTVVITRDQGRDNVIITFKPPEICSDESGVRAAYILEVRSEAGEVVYRTATEYHQSDLIEDSLTVDTCSSYSVNITVFVPSFPELGSHTNTSQFYISFGCPTDSYEVFPSQSVSPPDSLNPRESKKNGLTVALAVGTAVLVLVLAGVCVVCAVFVLRRRMKTVDTLRPLPHIADNPVYESATPIYDVIPESSHISKLQLAPEPEQCTDDNSRYAQTPVSGAAVCLLEREDSGICGSEGQRKLGEGRECQELGRETEAGTEKEDCYILMQ